MAGDVSSCHVFLTRSFTTLLMRRYASMPSPTTAVVLRIGENEDGTNL